MFYRILNDKLFDYADYDYAIDCLETDIITKSELDKDRNKVIILNGELILNPNYDTEQLIKAKQNKYNEALQKANDFQQNGTVEHKNCVFEMSDSNRKNLSDTEEALKLQGIEETTWLDKDDNYVVLTVDDIQYIRLNLILAEIQKLWIIKYPTYKELIAEAETVEEVNAIIIDYSQDEPPQPTVEPTPTEEPTIEPEPTEEPAEAEPIIEEEVND